MITYHGQASAPAPSTNDIHPTSHEAFAAEKSKRFVTLQTKQVATSHIEKNKISAPNRLMFKFLAWDL